MKDRFEQIYILGVRVDVVRLDDLVEYVYLSIREKNKVIISNVNVHAVNIAQELGWFKDFINRSQVVFCDGVGVKLRRQATKNPPSKGARRM